MQSYDESSMRSTGSKTAEDKQRLLTNYNSSFQNSSASVVNPFASSNSVAQTRSPIPAGGSSSSSHGLALGAGVEAGAAAQGLNSQSGTPVVGGTSTEYDRYPQGLTGSRVASMGSLGSKQSVANSALPGSSSTRYSTSSHSSEKSANPFLVDSDFSPFGGYPASSFPLHIDEKEDDDYLHNPDPIADADYDKHRFKYDLKSMDKRSGLALAGLCVFIIGIVGVFIVLPVLTYTGVVDETSGTTASPETYVRLTEYEYPMLSALRTTLIDPDTPTSAYSRQAKDGSYWKLVFSDEFATEGRTFYDGDDQFWYAPDLNYKATNDLEWYDPDAVTTSNGTLTLRMDAFKNHNLYYRSGMLHSWNRMCFTQGALELSAQFPNYGNISGLWPGMWSMGNLARPGYMATTDGVWPYSYEACDAGITANQSSPDGISYQPGQKLNSCTCKGEDHPNAGTGRGAPEIDVIEAEVDTVVRVGVASQSLQIAPYDIWYIPDYNWVEIYNSSVTSMNTYTGGPYQQAISATSTLNNKWYEYGSGDRYYQKYAFEYLNDNDDGYIRWFVGEDPTLTMHSYALAPNGNVDWRRISKEPMSIIINLGISNNWAYIDWPSIDFPVTMRVDYVRLYQPNDSVSVTCDPEDYPTYDYIEDHLKAYDIWNYTTWSAAGYSFPKNTLIDDCSA